MIKLLHISITIKENSKLSGWSLRTTKAGWFIWWLTCCAVWSVIPIGNKTTFSRCGRNCIYWFTDNILSMALLSVVK